MQFLLKFDLVYSEINTIYVSPVVYLEFFCLQYKIKFAKILRLVYTILALTYKASFMYHYNVYIVITKIPVLLSQALNNVA